MGTTTSRFGLHKPADADLARDFPAGLRPDMDVIDAALGMFPCTSGTRPASPQNGRMIRETDTGKAYFWDGTSWKQIYVEGAATAALNVGGVTSSEDIDVAAGKQVNVGASLSSAAFAAKVAGSGDLLAAVRFGTDTVDRLTIRADGNLAWGPGNAAADANLYRDSAGSLRTDGDFSVGGASFLGGSLLATSSGINALQTLFTQDIFVASGKVLYSLGASIRTGDPIVGAISDNSSATFGQNNNGPKIYFYWNGSNIQFVRQDTNAVVKTFVIDHPSDIEKFLVHATTESPHNGVEYWGTATVQDGIAEVELPAYFEDLTRNDGRAVLLTSVAPTADRKRPRRKGAKKKATGEPSVFPRVKLDEQGRSTNESNDIVLPPPAQQDRDDLVPQVAATYIRDGRFRIIADHGYPDTFEVSWLVKAIRSDVPLLEVEPLRSENELFGDGPYTYLRSKEAATG